MLAVPPPDPVLTLEDPPPEFDDDGAREHPVKSASEVHASCCEIGIAEWSEAKSAPRFWGQAVRR